MRIPSTAVRYRYQTIEFDQLDFHIRTLRDNQEYNDPDGTAEALGVSPSSWAMFGLLWPSGEALARVMQSYAITNLKILEVGCGVGLTSIVLNQRGASITATDHHPEAARHLAWNVMLNKGAQIPFFCEGWAEPRVSTGKFDLVVGADVLYEPNHPALLADFISVHTHRSAEVIIADPRRGNLSAFTRKMQNYGFGQQEMPDSSPTPAVLNYKGVFRRFVRNVA